MFFFRKTYNIPLKFLSIVALALFLSYFQCNRGSDVVDSWTAQRRVSAAHAAKLEQCNEEISLAILVPHDVREGFVRQCEADLLAADCPLKESPRSCFLLLFIKASNDV